MSKTIITAHIHDQTIRLSNLALIASGSQGVHQIRCEFDGAWDGYGKTAVFYRDKANVYHVPLTQDVATIPHEVMIGEGYFFFGVFGNADNTRTTETVRLRVEQGAITEATATPAEPTPDIYQQIMAAYGKMDSRLSEVIAMRGNGAAVETGVSDEYIYGTIKSNGTSAYIEFGIANLSLVAGGLHYSDYCIPPELAPLCNVELWTSNPDLNVTVLGADEEHDGWARILIDNPSTNALTTDMYTDCSGVYPLATPYSAELGDIRVGHDGTQYQTAGDAVREQAKTAIRYTEQTLTIGQKARARSNIDAIGISEGEETLFIECEQGGIASATGKESTGSNRLRSGYLETADLVKVATNDTSGYDLYGHFYDAEKTYVGNTGGWKDYFVMEDIIERLPGVHYFRIVVRKAGDPTLTPADAVGVFEATYKKRVIDAELVLYAPQSLTLEQQAQARANIGAASLDDVVLADVVDEKYFDITDDGVISLKREYRGALMTGAPAETQPFGESDKGIGSAGSKNAELPKNLVIPEIVDEIAVSGLAVAMFMNNNAVESITIPKHITAIPSFFALSALNLKAVQGTENVKVIGKTCFQQTPLKAVSFPNLKEATGANHFRLCSELISADVGNVTTISKGMFAYCQRLSAVHNAENVTEVGENAFLMTRRLKTLPFLSKLKTIGNSAFRLSRVYYNWQELVDTNACTFGLRATSGPVSYDGAPDQLNSTDWWSSCTYTPCENPLRSILDQTDPRWVDDTFGNTDQPCRKGCSLMSVAMIYSALTGTDLETIYNFENELVDINGGRYLESFEPNGDCFTDLVTEIRNFFNDIGMEATIVRQPYTSEKLQTMYDALADGALIWANIDGGIDGENPHVVVLYGVNSNGEMLAHDPEDGRVKNFGGANDMHFATYIQNLVEGASRFSLIVKKPSNV